MDVEDLCRNIAADQRAGVLPMAIVADAGTTNTGAIDPIKTIGEIARSQGIWLHVDGAYGLPGILDERKTALYQGLERADDDFGVPYYDFGVELSAPCRGVVVWALIREIGVDGMRARVRRHNDMAAHIAAIACQHPYLELLLPVRAPGSVGSGSA
jgi:aromatic-L-amino-acid decarboxylase